MTLKENERLAEALRTAGYDERRIKELKLVLEGKMNARDWAGGSTAPASFFSALLSGESENIKQKAEALAIEYTGRRAVYLLALEQPAAEETGELLTELYGDDVIVGRDACTLYLIHSLSGKRGPEEQAERILSTINTELMQRLRIAYGSVAEDLEDLAEAARQAETAMQVMKSFYGERLVMGYSAMGTGGLITELDEAARGRFLHECFGDKKSSRLSDEELKMVNRFFEHDLNISETARDLYMHRNTLVYHLEKVQKKTGLDIRHFDDAMRLKLALMIEAYAS